eukprot:scaffold1138_cov128-Cylindrotheca_fusiformis.AAC.35
MNKSNANEIANVTEAVLRKRSADSKLGIQFVNRNDAVCIYAVTSRAAKNMLSPSMVVHKINGESAKSALQAATIIRDSPAGEVSILAEKVPVVKNGPGKGPKERQPRSRKKLSTFRRTNNSFSEFLSSSIRSMRQLVRAKSRRNRRHQKVRSDGVVTSESEYFNAHRKESEQQETIIFSNEREVSESSVSTFGSPKPPKSHKKTLSFQLASLDDKDWSTGSEPSVSSHGTKTRRAAFRQITGTSNSTFTSLPEDRTSDFMHASSHSAAFASAELTQFVKGTRIKDWARNFRRSDPRYQILHFFNDVAQVGTNNMDKSFNPMLVSPLLRAFYKASVFTVWRPTSFDAIRRMMLHEGVGKGLDIKGKSAKKGKLSGFVPYLQIHQEEHKYQIRTLPKDGRIRVFYRSEAARDHALEKLNEILKEMMDTVERAEKIVDDDSVDEETMEWALEKLIWRMTNPTIHLIDDYVPRSSGMDVPERLFWEAVVKRRDISRAPNSENDTGRPSEPNFQNMNNVSLRKQKSNGGPKTVIMYYSDPNDEDPNPMDPLSFVMAYEEDGRVMPVVSDFDCFLIGTRGVEYKEPLADDQLKVLKWCVDQVENVLDEGKQAASWTSRWLNILKTEAAKGFHPEIPPLGFSDPKTNTIMKHAIHRLREEGSVRHGAECFNFYFPQELDDHFLVISDNLSGTSLPWKYVDPKGLQEILKEKIDAGYAFPINPKWILCDPGWKDVYDKLMSSQKSNVQDALRMWYPPESGIREKIEAIHHRHPQGFQRLQDQASDADNDNDGTAAMDLAEQELRYYLTFQRAKRKLRGMLIWKRILDEHRQSKGSVPAQPEEMASMGREGEN